MKSNLKMPSHRRLPSACSQRGGVLAFGLLGLLGVVLLAGAIWFFTCPCERTPGAYLFGEVAEQPVANWQFANSVELCQLQTYPGLIPHALNLNCMASQEGQLYLSCSQCEGKRWSTAALDNSNARLRIDGTVYPVSLARVTQPAELDTAWQARYSKLQQLSGDNAGAAQDVPERPGHWWSFQVVSR